jgi:uncharacterized protein (TIGR02391 family)
METLQSLFPNVDDLLAVSVEDLAPVLLRLGAAKRQNGMFWPEGVTDITIGSGMAAAIQQPYPHHKKRQVDALMNEGWERLRRDGLILPAPGINGSNGFMVLSGDGEAALASEDVFEKIKAARTFPKELLHPSITKKVSSALMRGDYDQALREAFTIVEVSAREAGDYADTDIGVDLMRKAFSAKNGKLTDYSLPEAERDGYAHLFAGAIGAFKNPHSHRVPGTSDIRVTQDRVLLASQLLQIVDAAKARLNSRQ